MKDAEIGSLVNPMPAARVAPFVRVLRPAGMALLAGIASGMLVGTLGCRAPTRKIELASSFMAPRQDLDYTREMLNSNARRWTSLTANCEILISNPQIPGEAHLVTVNDGRLVFSKPGNIRLAAPDSDDPGVRMVGDSNVYRVDMPLFASASSSYSGKYSDPIAPQQGRITFLPTEVAAALEPTNLLVNRAQMLTQLESLSALYSLIFVTTPAAAIKPTGLVVLDRRTERPAQLEEYNVEDGALRAKIAYLGFETLPVAGEEAAVVPTRFRIIYPEEQTTIEILLHDVTLNAKINPAQFKVPG